MRLFSLQMQVAGNCQLTKKGAGGEGNAHHRYTQTNIKTMCVRMKTHLVIFFPFSSDYLDDAIPSRVNNN